MKIIRYFFADANRLIPIESTHKLIQKVKWHRDETLKVEVWPFDLKIGPTTVPYQPNNKKHDLLKKLTAALQAERDEKNSRPGQEPLVRLNQASTPYSTEFTKRDDARNRAYLSPKVPQRRKGRKKPPPQDDAPF